MATGGKYVPPHMRNRSGGGDSRSSSSSRDRGGYDDRRGGRDRRDDRRDDRKGGSSFWSNDRRGGDRRGGDRREDREEDSRSSSTRSNSRWKDFDKPVSSRGRGGGRGGGAKNGWSGSDRLDKRLEKQLFESEHVSAGINFDKYDDIPVETSGDNVPDPVDKFTEEQLTKPLFENTVRANFKRPTPVQKFSIPIGALGRDLMACAQTGSGKTGGFLFPVIAQMLKSGPKKVEDLDDAGTKNASQSYYRRRRVYPNALIIAPTRELAIQIYDQARKFCYATGIAPCVVYGGAKVSEQLRAIEREGCDLLVATPGRLVDLIERGRISLACIRFLVLDEADRMLDMGFEPQIRRIVQEEDMPRESGRQTLMFSATFPTEIQRLSADFMNDYIFLAVGRVGNAAADIDQKIEYVDEHEKMDFLERFLSQIEDKLVLVFVETKRSADRIEDVLCRMGIPATSIHGDRTQREREDALYDFKTGRRPVIVATDVASRGLDIPNVAYVINFDMPNNIDDYVHRIGRTGRAGNVGNAISLINEKNRNVISDLYTLLKDNKQDIPSFLEDMQYRYGRGGGRGRRSGGGRFGGRDYRNKGGNQRRGGGGGRRGGGDRDFGGGRDSRRGGSRDRGGSDFFRRGGGGGGFSRSREDNSDW